MLDKDRILDIVRDELDNADTNLDFETPLNYYLGNPRGDETKGHSTVVSTDVADSIEWVMPQIMKSFTQNNEVVIFDAIHPGDEKQAEIESEYVYEVLMKENPGFVLLHQFVKDALLQNNGILKVYYDADPQTVVKEFTGLDIQQLQSVLMQPNVDIISKEETFSLDPATNQPIPSYNITISSTTNRNKICIEAVAPEDFRVNSDHNSIDLTDARFTAHLLTKSMSDLTSAGYDTEDLRAIDEDYFASDYRFTAQGEAINQDISTDPAMRMVNIAECYLYMDVNEDDIAEYVKVVVAGHETPTRILDIEELDESPWISTTTFVMSHKWRGLSIYDRLKQIQDQKTSLWRNLFDNIYLQNNQRHLVTEGQVNIDDLLVSRPGGIVRVKRADAVTPLVNPAIGDSVFNMMQYLDLVRAGRVGVAPEGEVSPPHIGDRVGSVGVERLLSAKEELVGLIVRVVAETGIKPLCVKIRDLCTAHRDAIQDFMFRGQWVKINPSQWPERSKCTVRVGTGTGNHERQVLALKEVLAIQAQLQQMPGQALVDQPQAFAALDDFCKFSGLNTAAKYFLDPSSPQGQQKTMQAQQQAQQIQQIQQQSQQAVIAAQTKLADAELQKAAAQQAAVSLKAQVEQSKAMLELQRQQFESTIAALKQQLDSDSATLKTALEMRKLELEEQKFFHTAAVELTELEAVTQKQKDAEYAANKETVQ